MSDKAFAETEKKADLSVPKAASPAEPRPSLEKKEKEPEVSKKSTQIYVPGWIEVEKGRFLDATKVDGIKIADNGAGTYQVWAFWAGEWTILNAGTSKKMNEAREFAEKVMVRIESARRKAYRNLHPVKKES